MGPLRPNGRLGTAPSPSDMTYRDLITAAAATFALLTLTASVGCMRPRCAGGSRWSEQQSPASQVVQVPLRGRHTIRVGAGPSDLLVVDDGRTLVCKNVEEHALSIIDLSARREVARIRLPVSERGKDGVAPGGWVAGRAEDRAM